MSRHLLRLCPVILAAFSLVWAFAAPARADVLLFADENFASLDPISLAHWIDDVPAPAGDLPALSVLEPASGVVIPADCASPLIRWEASDTAAWLVTVASGDQVLARGMVGDPRWEPDRETWEGLKRDGAGRPLTLIVAALGGMDGRTPTAVGSMALTVSPEPLGAPMIFIRKPLPFRKAKENPTAGELVVGRVDSYGPPYMVMTNQPICFNCHALSGDGSLYGVDMDFKGDKGAYALVRPRERMAMEDGDFVTWNELPAPAPATYSMGLFTRISPDGAHLASTVGESSLFIMMDDLWYSQLFYPATGSIGIMDSASGHVRTLPGADLPEFSQTCPEFSPDGRSLLFARTPVNPHYVRLITGGKLRWDQADQTIDVLNERFPARFDICRIPFDQGRGGRAVPLEGASDNGYSNYFPRYSPDGRWIVFTRSRTGLVLQPDSRLCIIPAQGGPARVLASNNEHMNSWHAWSPNGHWLAFSSKADNPFTEIWLTHMDENGVSSPPLRLHRFSSKDRACMTPEFIPNDFVLKRLELARPDEAVGTTKSKDGR